MPIFKKTKCRMKWCYSPLRHEDGTCDKICTYNTIRVQTNADHIRAMSDEELAAMFNIVFDPWCNARCKDGIEISCRDCILEWLKKESE